MDKVYLMDMNNTDAFATQQTRCYREGRKAHNLGVKIWQHPYTTGSQRAAAWQNGWRDASQGIGANGFQATDVTNQ